VLDPVRGPTRSVPWLISVSLPLDGNKRKAVPGPAP
jgi:hypothetical protein